MLNATFLLLFSPRKYAFAQKSFAKLYNYSSETETLQQAMLNCKRYKRTE